MEAKDMGHAMDANRQLTAVQADTEATAAFGAAISPTRHP